MVLQPYQYQPLGINEIRLMQLSRQEDRTPSFRLVCAVLDDSLDFEAVSYTWGSERRESAIRHAESEQVICVTANCQETLQSLCNLESGVFWMDAVCIDQDNIHERSSQVKLMGQIFRKAKRTIAYVGKPDPVSLQLKGCLLNEMGSELLKPLLRSFLDRSWFRRTWVVQEALLSRDLVIRVGDENLDTHELMSCSERHYFDTVLTLKARFSRSPARTGTLRPPAERRGLNRSASRLLLWREPPTISRLLTKDSLMNWGNLFDLMCASLHYNCSDPRDKLFALVSLFNGEIPKDLEPDYSLNMFTLQTNISRFLLCYGVVRTLAAAQGVCPGPPRQSTWVVDWQQLKPHKLNRYENGWYHANPSFRAGFLQTGRRIHVQPVDKNVLCIRGLRLGTIVELTQQPSAVYRIQWLIDFSSRNDRTTKKAENSTKIPYLELDSYHTPSATTGMDVYQYQSDNEVDMGWQPRARARTDLSGLSCHKSLDAFVEAQDIDSDFAGFLPKQAKVNDCVCLLLGFRTPFVLRPVSSGWKLVGECYINGVMEGEAMRDINADSVNLKEPVAPLEDFLLC